VSRRKELVDAGFDDAARTIRWHLSKLRADSIDLDQLADPFAPGSSTPSSSAPSAHYPL
jgi:hypothetical protein